MTEASESAGDAQVTFKVKTSADGLHTITMAESATVLDLKTKLSSSELENIPVERQRLIYSGRVMKNDDSLATYKIKAGNTVHMVKSAASNPSQPASSASTAVPAPQAVPSNMASGTANNPLANLTGARYAGHQINLPGMDAFGPDGGMGPPMDEERMQRMMEDPNVLQSMNEALNDPDFINMLISSNPMLQNMPNAREIISSPLMRQMMTNPQMMTQAMRMQRNMHGVGGAFPAPGATDTTPEGAAASGNSRDGGSNNNNNNNNNNSNADTNPLLGNPFMTPMMGAGDQQQLLQQLSALGFGGFGQAGEARSGGNAGRNQETQTPAGGNPFAALFQGGLGGLGGQMRPFGGMGAEEFRQLAQAFNQQAAMAAPVNNTQPPEELYAEQLRQLNEMGFYDFGRNVTALRRSGGSVQGAIEHLLSAND